MKSIGKNIVWGIIPANQMKPIINAPTTYNVWFSPTDAAIAEIPWFLWFYKKYYVEIDSNSGDWIVNPDMWINNPLTWPYRTVRKIYNYFKRKSALNRRKKFVTFTKCYEKWELPKNQKSNI